ncbi:MAG: hypothetical protein P4M00_13180 [Azospirillaceae bacterium]|nr:hypothetical protein [Azospirillaceae bacterium]
MSSKNALQRRAIRNGDLDASRAVEIGTLPYKPTRFTLKKLQKVVRIVKEKRSRGIEA